MKGKTVLAIPYYLKAQDKFLLRNNAKLIPLCYFTYITDKYIVFCNSQYHKGGSKDFPTLLVNIKKNQKRRNSKCTKQKIKMMGKK